MTVKGTDKQRSRGLVTRLGGVSSSDNHGSFLNTDDVDTVTGGPHTPPDRTRHNDTDMVAHCIVPTGVSDGKCKRFLLPAVRDSHK